MKNFFAALLLFVGTLSFAQTSAITATATDSDAQTWNNGTYQIYFVAPSGYTGSAYTFNGSPWTPPTPINGSLNGAGNFSYSPLPRNDYILPSGSGWAFKICPNASAPCSTTTIVINQASMNLSGSLVLVAPRFAAGNLYNGSYGYLDVEVTPTPAIGLQYWNVTMQCQRSWNGSIWGCVGTSNVPVCSATQLPYYASDGNLLACLNLGTGLTIAGGNLNATGSGLNQLTGDVAAGPGTGSQASTVIGLKNVPFCSGFTPTNGQVVTYTTGGTPNPCYAAATPSTSGITQLTGDIACGPGSGSQACTLPPVSSTSGTCGDATHSCQVTTNAKGQTTAQTQVAITATGLNQLTGDILAGPGTGSQIATLPTVNGSPGTCGDATHVCQVTVNGKGQTTAQTQVAITSSGNIPSNAIFVFTGTSMNFDDSHVLSTAVTITGWTTSTGVTTVTNSGTNNFSAGQWVDMVAATSWPVNGTYNSGTGTRIFQVLSSGLSSTQFEINTSGISAGSCASTCGSAYSASAYLPYATTASAGMPVAAPTNTYDYCSVSDPNSHACTLYGIATNYTNMLHSISPVVTGIPGYLIINGPNNDLGLNYTLTNIETYYQTIFADAHTDGWTVMIGSPTGANINQSGANNFSAYQSAIDEWLRGQGKTTVQAVTPGSSQYWDLWTDVGNQLWDGSNTDIIASNTGLGPDGAKMAALTIATDLENGNGRPLPRRVGDWWTQPVGAGSTGNTSYAFVPSVPASSQVILYRWFTSSAMTTNAAELTTGGAFWAQQIVAGTGGGVGWSNCPGSWPFCVKTSGGETLSVADNGVLFGASGFTAASGGSNSNAWNTNGGVTAIPSAVAALPPYEQIGSTLYIPADGMFTANLPPSSPTWINSVAPGTITPQTNGDLILGTAATSTDYFLEETGGGTSVEAVVNNLYTASATKNASISVWIYDSTNSKVWAFGPVAPIAASSVGQFSISSYTYSGSGNPSFGSGTAVGFGVAGWGSPIHLKIVTASGTASFEVCINGGLSCKVFGTESVGTISDGGIHVYDGGSNQVTDVLSLKVQ